MFSQMNQMKTTSCRTWILGARPLTLSAGLSGVLAGTATTLRPGFGWGQGVIWWRLVLALVVALGLQIGANYANDYSDGLRGVDNAQRVGPRRLVGSGLAQPKAVRRAAFVSFGVAAAAGVALAATVNWLLLIPGAFALLAGWFYSGGSKPYGYHGWGEAVVFLFFGMVSTVGSAWIQLETFTGLSFVVAAGVGALTTALLVVNNLRDITGDEAAGKRTLAVRMGDRRTRIFFTALAVTPFALAWVTAQYWEPWTALVWVAWPFAMWPIVDVLGLGGKKGCSTDGGSTEGDSTDGGSTNGDSTDEQEGKDEQVEQDGKVSCRVGKQGKDLLPALGATGFLALLYTGFLTLGFWLGSVIG